MEKRYGALKGRVTLPAQAGMEKQIMELGEKWGIDAVRDSDGTKLSKEIMDMGYEVYTTFCIIREDNEWAKSHPEYLQEMYLMSKPEIAVSGRLEIDLLKGYFREQFMFDRVHDPREWWEVIDRTTGDRVDYTLWDYKFEDGVLIIRDAKKWHKYTVNFLVYQIWEPVSMYNHITNSWTEEHKMPIDPRHPEVRKHLLGLLENWLRDHSSSDVVRFTTFFYNFDLIYNESGKERQVDWFGYLSSVSPLAMKEFETAFGYKLCSEDFIDNGYYNSPFRPPSKKYLDWMDFQQRFVSSFAAECVELVHRAGKKVIMFLGDHWIGTEPYGKYFGSIGLDAVVGAAGDGVTLRMISDIPVKSTEARFYPYLFPDVFHKGGDPVRETMKTWIKSRRAILRRPVDRMGYGGYLSLAVQFPDFIEKVADICNEFRLIHERSGGIKPVSAPFKVAILNSWGKIRSWQTHQIAHSLWNQRCYSYLGVLEALSGMNLEVEFISFEDIKEKGISQTTGVIINLGDAGTAWSGADYWKDEKLVTALREWVYNGGGFIGVGEPTAVEYQGSFFQLSDVLGVQKETGCSLSHNKEKISTVSRHFIIEDINGEIDFGEGMNSIYKCGENTTVLSQRNMSCSLAVNEYGIGRAVYISGLPYSLENTRLLLRAIYWSAGGEEYLKKWFSVNPAAECTAYNNSPWFVVINNEEKFQSTVVYDGDGREIKIDLKPYESVWVQK